MRDSRTICIQQTRQIAIAILCGVAIPVLVSAQTNSQTSRLEPKSSQSGPVGSINPSTVKRYFSSNARAEPAQEDSATITKNDFQQDKADPLNPQEEMDQAIPQLTQDQVFFSKEGFLFPSGIGERSFQIDPFRTVLPKTDLLPVPRRENDLFYTPFHKNVDGISRTSDGFNFSFFPLNRAVANDNKAFVQFDLKAAFGMFFDTGSPTDPISVAALPLVALPTDGQTQFLSKDNTFVNNPITILTGAQVRNVMGAHAHVNVEADSQRASNEFRLVQGSIRFWNKKETTILAGKSQSLFGTQGYMVPSIAGINAGLVGVGRFSDEKINPIQFRLQVQPENEGLGFSLGVEEPIIVDFLQPGQNLDRIPTFAGSILYKGVDELNRLQIAGIIRTLGFEAVSGAEQFESGWGISVYGSRLLFRDDQQERKVFAGLAGGNGIGGYINGIQHSVVFDAGGNSLVALEAIGGYVGLGNDMLLADDKRIATHVAYGFSSMETPVFLAAETNSNLHQAFANVLYYFKDNAAIGFEYQFGRRSTRAAGAGDNNRFMFVLAVATPRKDATVATQAELKRAGIVSPLDTPSGMLRGSNANRQGF